MVNVTPAGDMMPASHRHQGHPTHFAHRIEPEVQFLERGARLEGLGKGRGASGANAVPRESQRTQLASLCAQLPSEGSRSSIALRGSQWDAAGLGGGTAATRGPAARTISLSATSRARRAGASRKVRASAWAARSSIRFPRKTRRPRRGAAARPWTRVRSADGRIRLLLRSRTRSLHLGPRAGSSWSAASPRAFPATWSS